MKALLFQHGSERFEGLLSLSSLGLRMPVRGVLERSPRSKAKPLGGELNNNQQCNLLSSVAGLIQGSGGIQGLMMKFNSEGLGDLVKGWVSTGPNPPVSPRQMEQVLGAADLDQMAAQTGIARDQIASLVAETLPKMVDKLTPDGEPVSWNDLQQSLSSLLQGGFGELLS